MAALTVMAASSALAATLVLSTPSPLGPRRFRSLAVDRTPAGEPLAAPAGVERPAPFAPLGRAVRGLLAQWSRWCRWSGRLLSWYPGRTTRTDSPRSGSSEARVGAAATLGLAAMLVWPVVAVPVAVLVWAWPAWRSRAARGRRQRGLVEVLPDLVELFRLTAAAGLSVHQSVRALSGRVDPLIRPALAEVMAREDRGQRLADALAALADRGESLRPLAATLVAAERYGAPLSAALDRLATEARDLRRRQAEGRARRLPVLMLFPLVLCILPAATLLTLVPLLVASWPHFSG